MSTFLHSAAMSLLSRTLQTVLSKYLSEVDVQGIAVPSLTDTTSGWGVRLSNVKLREGVKLYDLPGRMPSTSTSTSTKKQGSQRRRRRRKQQRNSQRTTTKTVSKPQGKSMTTKAANEPERLEHVNGDDEHDTPSLPPQHSLETVTEGEVEMEETTKPSTRPRGGWFSWFSSSGTAAETGAMSEHDEPNAAWNEHVQNSNSNDPLVGRVVHDNFESPMNGVHQEEPRHDDPHDLDYNQDEEETEDDDYDDENDESDMDEPKVQSQSQQSQQSESPPMMLRLGKGGTIGTLDVRLIGKTIHVLVEDAVLPIEIVRSTSSSSGAATAAATTTDMDDETLSQQQPPYDSATSASAPPPAAAAAPKKARPPPKTAGDRVLAENAIARLFSILPNLFLRDLRVRLILRDEHDDEQHQQHATNGDVDNDATYENGDYTSNDTVIEVSIELLSVNDGKDFLLNFGGISAEEGEAESTSSSSLDDSVADARTGEISGAVASSKGSGVEVANEFLTKRIRTGRGSEGGIVVRIFQWGEDDAYNRSGEGHASLALPPAAAAIWARDSWNASAGLVLLRCSGLDVQAKIFLGTKKEIAISNHGYYADDFANGETSVDTMLFGVDYIVPGPQKAPSLPDIISPGVANLDDNETWANLVRVVTFTADAAGIQSCRLPSPFHKVARNLFPKHCKGNHLPCEWCHRCWTKESGAESRPHRLDGSTPLAGLVLHASVRDPLEVNVDRYNLSVLGLVIGLFSKKTTKMEMETAVDGGSADDATTLTIPNESQRSSTRPGAYMASHSLDDSYRSTTTGTNHKLPRSSFSGAIPKEEKDGTSLQTSFPIYMQPEKIQILGVHLAEVQFRVHMLRTSGIPEGGRSYSYWDMVGKCLTTDFQSMAATERPFQDLRFDVGHLIVVEHRGASQKQIVSLGVRQRVVDMDELTVETFVTAEKNHKRSPWPTTAAAIIDIPPPLESLVYADRERHALQLRFVSVLDASEQSKSRSRKDAILRVGVANVDVKFAIKDDIMQVISEARSTLLGPSKPSSTEGTTKSTDSLLLYKVTADGGRVRMEPMVDARLPSTNVEGEISTSHGFSLQLFLDKFHVGYGATAPPRALVRGLSIHQLAHLPDNVRLRILLFLKDLKPLEAALELPESTNTFLRCRAVNKGIVTVSERLKLAAMESTVADHLQSSRRQELLHRVALLDDEIVETLLTAHERRHRMGRVQALF